MYSLTNRNIGTNDPYPNLTKKPNKQEPPKPKLKEKCKFNMGMSQHHRKTHVAESCQRHTPQKRRKLPPPLPRKVLL